VTHGRANSLIDAHLTATVGSLPPAGNARLNLVPRMAADAMHPPAATDHS
jgi:hypothetical protein